MQHVKGYISFTGMHFVDASDYHTLIMGECDVWKHVKYLLICKLDSAITAITQNIKYQILKYLWN